MFEHPSPRPLCDVMACDRPASGSYLQSARGGSAEFNVCDEHLSRPRAGRRPMVVAAEDTTACGGRPALVFPFAPGDGR
jgi:hypothetical protein